MIPAWVSGSAPSAWQPHCLPRRHQAGHGTVARRRTDTGARAPPGTLLVSLQRKISSQVGESVSTLLVPLISKK